jgi:hypothetical protein
MIAFTLTIPDWILSLPFWGGFIFGFVLGIVLLIYLMSGINPFH